MRDKEIVFLPADKGRIMEKKKKAKFETEGMPRTQTYRVTKGSQGWGTNERSRIDCRFPLRKDLKASDPDLTHHTGEKWNVC